MTNHNFEPLIAQSEQIKIALDQLQIYFQQKEPILLLGEKGTGKDFLSSYIHQQKETNGLLLMVK